MACSVLTFMVMAAWARAAWADVAMCPGESGRYGDHKCNHDPTHRFCAQLLDASGQPQSWGPKGDFWQITGQNAFKWDDEIRANKGDSWCICMWAAARLITTVGCENVHLHCDATDVDYIVKQYSDGGVDLQPAKQCLLQKCGGTSPVQESDAGIPQIAGGSRATAFGGLSRSARSLAGMAAIAMSSAAAGALVWRLRSLRAPRTADDAGVAMTCCE